MYSLVWTLGVRTRTSCSNTHRTCTACCLPISFLYLKGRVLFPTIVVKPVHSMYIASISPYRYWFPLIFPGGLKTYMYVFISNCPQTTASLHTQYIRKRSHSNVVIENPHENTIEPLVFCSVQFRLGQSRVVEDTLDTFHGPDWNKPKHSLWL